MAKFVIIVIFIVLLFNFSLQNGVSNSDQQFICGTSKYLSKCGCEQETDRFEHIPLFNIDCSRLDFEECPSENVLPYFMGHLDLSHNSITTLDESSKLTSNSLYYLDFSYNKIKLISDKYFQNLTRLIYLNLGHNKLKQIDDLFNGLTNLKTLNLQSNKIQTLSGQAFTQLGILEELILNYNNLGAFLEGSRLSQYVPNSIISLHLDHVHLKNISTVMFEDMRQLNKLSIAYNPFSELPYLPLEFLKYLDISGTKITNITTKSLSFPNLKILKMNRLPYITKIYDYAFYNLHKLEELYIEHCIRLEEMEPITLGYITEKESLNQLSLRKFSVAYSGLKYLPDTFQFIFRDLEEIELRGNFWDCSCKLIWLTHMKKKVKYIDEIRCSSPESQANKTIFNMSEEEFSCFQTKKITSRPGAPTQSWLFPLIGVLSIIILILVAVLIYVGPYGQNIYKTEGKMVGPDSPYNPVTIYPNQAESFKL